MYTDFGITSGLPSPRRAVELARERLDRTTLVGVRTVPVPQAVGLVSAVTVFARCACPTAHVATMDGVAVVAARTRGARPERPAIFELGRTCIPVATGWALPEGMDAVIPQERLEELPDGRLCVAEELCPWTFVRCRGSDLDAGDVILYRGARISPYDLGALLSGGIFEVEVFESVRLVFIPTGNEILPCRDRPTPRPGEVIESNSEVFCALARRYGVEASSVPPVRDDPTALEAAVRSALIGGAHVVVVGAGSSAGPRDFSARVFESLGCILVRGVAMQPGRPSILGVTDGDACVPGGRLLGCAPGHSAGAVAFLDELLGPLLAWLGRCDPPERLRVRARLGGTVRVRPDLTVTVRVFVGRVGDELLALPVRRSEGMLRSLARAQGVLHMPPGERVPSSGEGVEVELAAPLAEVERVVLCAGGPDPALDLLADECLALDQPLRLVAARAGREAALAALREKRVLLAAIIRTEGEDLPAALQRELPGLAVRLLPLGAGGCWSLVVPEAHRHDPRVMGVCSAALSDEFRTRLARLSYVPSGGSGRQAAAGAISPPG